MPLIIFCEKCNYKYETIAFTKSDGTTDGQMSKCPKCGHWNGGKYLIDQFKKFTGKESDYVDFG